MAGSGELSQGVLAQVKKRFTEAKSDHWDSWFPEDMKADLKTFYNKTGVYLSWSLFEDKFEPVLQRTGSYAIGVKEGNECWHINNITDRSATSNVGEPPFTMSMEIDAKTYGEMILYYQGNGTVRKIKVYMTNQQFHFLSEYNPEDLCIIQHYPIGN